MDENNLFLFYPDNDTIFIEKINKSVNNRIIPIFV